MITSTIKTLTPADAKALLGRNGKYQRTVNASRAKRIGDAMATGTFKLTGQTIVIDRDGNLLDGQHRLTGQCLANVDFTYLVVEGEDPENFQYYDLGTKRTAAQFINSRHRSVMHAAAKLIIEYRARPTAMRIVNGRVGNEQPISEILEAIEGLNGLEAMAGEARLIYEATGINAPTLLAVTYLGGIHAPDLVDPWFSGLHSGAELVRKDPRLALRNTWARNAKLLNVSGAQITRWVYIVRAWNAFVQDEPITLLRHNPALALPLIYGTRESRAVAEPIFKEATA
jgi:hypothetical protein